MQEDNTISGGNKVTNLDTLMNSLKGQLKDAEEDYFGLLPFDSP
jgi:hypothetical protein